MSERAAPGTVGWMDLTVDNAEETAAFYESVLGWTRYAVDMGEYEDWAMIPAVGGGPVGGICHARGKNAGIPKAWMVYFVVEDLDVALAAVRDGGGRVVGAVKHAGDDRYAIIEDPAGVACALYQYT